MKLSNFFNYLIAAILALSVFVLIYCLVEFQVTEVWMITPKISPLISSFFLLILILIFSLVNWVRMVQENKLFLVFLLELILLVCFVYPKYRQQKLAREYLPKIYSINPPEWGIQAHLVDIRGKNFFPAHREGKIFLDGDRMLIEKWSDDLIIAKQQVPPKFGQVKLYLIRDDGMMSNTISFDVKNPDELLDF